MKRISKLLVLTALFESACFRLPNSSTGQSSTIVRRAKTIAAETETKLAKTVTTVDANAIEDVKMEMPAESKLAGTSITIAPGSLSISAALVVEQGADLADSAMTSEVSLAADVEIKQAGQGTIIRPSEKADLSKELKLALPLPTLLGARLSASTYAVYYKYLDPTSNQLLTGIKIVDDVNVKIGFDESAQTDIIEFGGYFGIYWVVVLSRPITKEEVPAPKPSVEPIMNKNNAAVITQTGIVSEKEILAVQATPEVIWKDLALSWDKTERKVKVVATPDAAVNSCKADFFESSSDLKGVVVEKVEATAAVYAVQKLTAHKLTARLRCHDAKERLTITAWSDMVSVDAYPLAVVTAVSSSKKSGTFGFDSKIPISVTFDKKVTVTGSPTLTLQVATGKGRDLSYVSGSGSETLYFEYAVAAGDETPSLNYASKTAFGLPTGSSIVDSNGVAVDLTLPDLTSTSSLSAQALVIDTVAPSAPSSVGFASNNNGSTSLAVSFSAGSDANLKQHNVKLCSTSDCSTSCGTAQATTTASYTFTGVTPASYYACAQSEDNAGNMSAYVSSLSPVNMDSTAPTIVSLKTTLGDGAYKAGQSVTLQLKFSETVYLDGSGMTVIMNVGREAVAAYDGGSGSDTLIFKFNILDGDSIALMNARTTNPIVLNGSTVKDAANNAAVLTLGGGAALSETSNISIDAIAPTAPTTVFWTGGNSSGSLNLSLSYTQGTDANLDMHKAMVCSTSACNTGCTTPVTSLSSPAAITVPSEGIYYGCIKAYDMVGNSSNMAVTAGSIVVDTAAPSVTSVNTTAMDDYYSIDDTLDITVTFSENVTVTSSGITLALAVPSTQTISYTSGSGSNVLHFSYQPTAGHSSGDLDYVGTNSLSLGAATIKDAAGNDANLTLPPTGSGSSIAGQKAIIIDTTAPTLPSSITAPNYSNNPNVSVSWTGSSDANFKEYGIKFCSASDCSTNCGVDNFLGGSNWGATLSEGMSYACVKAVDMAGNASNYAVSSSITVDTTAPTIDAEVKRYINTTTTLYTPVINGGATSYLWEKTDGPDNVTFSNVNGSTTNATVNGGSQGIYKIRLTASDAALNQDQEEFTFVYDTDVPSFAGVDEAIVLPGGTEVRIFWRTASDNLTSANDMYYDVCFSSSLGTCGSSFTTNFSVQGRNDATINGLSAGTPIEVLVRARDASGNRESNFTIKETQNLANITKIVAGRAHTCALLNDYTVKCWGNNDFGQLGNASTISSPYPVTVSGLTGAQDITAGKDFTCARTSTNIQCWGDNTFGQVGATAGTYITTTTVKATASFTALSAGDEFACAIKSDGMIDCWGRGLEGQLGNNTFVSSATPVAESTASTWLKISAGSNHVCAIATGNNIYCWGENSWGQLGAGVGDTTSRSVAFSVNGGTPATQVAAGGAHTCFAFNNQVSCMGKGDQGELGTGLLNNYETPASAGSFANVINLFARDSTTCMLDGTSLKCWGLNNLAMLAVTNTDAVYTPTAIAGSYTKIAMGTGHICAVEASQKARCWGSDEHGQLGLGYGKPKPMPVDIGFNTVSQLALGARSSCVLQNSGAVSCWGGDALMLGRNFHFPSSNAQTVTAGGNFTSITAGAGHVCGARNDSTFECWGAGASGQIGHGSNADAWIPATVTSMNGSVISTGYNFTCATDAGNKSYCWGDNTYGNLGMGSAGGSTNVRTTISGNPLYSQISSGFMHSCGIVGNAVYCWGAGGYGQIGNGLTADQSNPQAVTGLPAITRVSVGSYHSCALDTNGSVHCWGMGSLGQIGNGQNTTQNSSPQTVSGISSQTRIASGDNFSCALSNTGYVRCWGQNAKGQLGDGTFANSLTPVLVAGLPLAKEIYAGSQRACAVLLDDSVRCWGDASNHAMTAATPVIQTPSLWVRAEDI